MFRVIEVFERLKLLLLLKVSFKHLLEEYLDVLQLEHVAVLRVELKQLHQNLNQHSISQGQKVKLHLLVNDLDEVVSANQLQCDFLLL